MRRSLLITIALLALAAPALAQQAVVAKYRGQYPTPMAKAQILALERSVAAEVHGGLLRKPDGNSCDGYACDIICFSDSQLFDILGDSEGAATPSWNPTTNPRGYHCELVAPVVPPPPVTPDPDASTAAIEARIAALESRLEDAHTAFAALEGRVSAIEHAGPSSSGSTPPPATSDLAADVQRIRELLELVAKRFGLQ